MAIVKKKIYTKNEFQIILDKKAKKMNDDNLLFKKSYQLISQADKYFLTHQTKFLNETSLNNPYDLLVFSEIVYDYKPDYIIELGTAWCGTTLYLASLL
ncbi:cephalosporin hydroxylase family protein, partial [Alphaproteobacteria bacterium]|nr:cephalosporin hydroxylase family protein [Alphaproteobacteria bacterium]